MFWRAKEQQSYVCNLLSAYTRYWMQKGDITQGYLRWKVVMFWMNSFVMTDLQIVFSLERVWLVIFHLNSDRNKVIRASVRTRNSTSGTNFRPEQGMSVKLTGLSNQVLKFSKIYQSKICIFKGSQWNGRSDGCPGGFPCSKVNWPSRAGGYLWISKLPSRRIPQTSTLGKYIWIYSTSPNKTWPRGGIIGHANQLIALRPCPQSLIFVLDVWPPMHLRYFEHSSTQYFMLQ